MEKQFYKNVCQRPLWLLMAVLCIVFSGASKRLMQLRFERKVNNHLPAGILISKRVKDGCRDKRHHLRSVVYADKQSPDKDDLGVFILPDFISLHFPAIFERHYSAVNSALQDAAAPATPLFLLHRRLQV